MKAKLVLAEKIFGEIAIPGTYSWDEKVKVKVLKDVRYSEITIRIPNGIDLAKVSMQSIFDDYLKRYLRIREILNASNMRILEQWDEYKSICLKHGLTEIMIDNAYSKIGESHYNIVHSHLDWESRSMKEFCERRGYHKPMNEPPSGEVISFHIL